MKSIYQHIKNFLKKYEIILTFYVFLHAKLVAFLTKISPVMATKYLYKRATGKKIDLKNPKNFNEKLQYLKLYWQHPLVVVCADKYEVRNYVIECGCEDVLNEIYGIYNNTAEINWSSFPEKFVLKTTNGCGSNIICDNKANYDEKAVLNKLNEWLKTDYGLRYAEIHYSKIKPRIICEKYIETEDGFLPNDYKVFCFNGEPKFILAINERETGNIQRYFFDVYWNELDYEKRKVNSTDQNRPRKPNSLDFMIYCAKKLSGEFPFVRIDFYDSKNRPIFGEMTFTPLGGLATYYKDEVSIMLGDWINLPVRRTFEH